MNAINAIGIDAGLITNNQTSATQQINSVIDPKTPKNEAPKDALQDKLEISTRAQKIQKLNEEFFTGDIKSFTISQDFLQRLAEYGFITTEQASDLGLKSVPDKLTDSATVGGLLTFIDSFSASLKKVDPDHSLIDVLQQAKTVLNNFNGPSQNNQNINIVQVSSQLQSYIDSAPVSMPKTDIKALNQLVAALDIAKVLTPGKNTIAQINSYLAITKL